jgi:hypothetical protein
MNMNSPRLDDKLNGVALATILAIVISIICAGLSIVADSSVSPTAQAQSPSKIVASTNVAIVRR